MLRFLFRVLLSFVLFACWWFTPFWTENTYSPPAKRCLMWWHLKICHGLIQQTGLLSLQLTNTRKELASVIWLVRFLTQKCKWAYYLQTCYKNDYTKLKSIRTDCSWEVLHCNDTFHLMHCLLSHFCRKKESSLQDSSDASIRLHISFTRWVPLNHKSYNHGCLHRFIPGILKDYT